MNNLERINYYHDLKYQKSAYMDVSNLLKNFEENCLHVCVDLGYHGKFPSSNENYCCLFCEKNNFFYSVNVIHAENYLPEYNVNKYEDCNKKFKIIQELAIKILNEEPELTRSELTDRINNIIDEELSNKLR